MLGNVETEEDANGDSLTVRTLPTAYPNLWPPPETDASGVPTIYAMRARSEPVGAGEDASYHPEQVVNSYTYRKVTVDFESVTFAVGNNPGATPEDIDSETGYAFYTDVVRSWAGQDISILANTNFQWQGGAKLNFSVPFPISSGQVTFHRRWCAAPPTDTLLKTLIGTTNARLASGNDLSGFSPEVLRLLSVESKPSFYPSGVSTVDLFIVCLLNPYGHNNFPDPTISPFPTFKPVIHTDGVSQLYKPADWSALFQ